MEKIKSLLLPLLAPLIALLKPLIKKEIEEKLLAPKEKQIKESTNQIDDALGLPGIEAIRKFLATW
jgi:hypothetical protein